MLSLADLCSQIFEEDGQPGSLLVRVARTECDQPGLVRPSDSWLVSIPRLKYKIRPPPSLPIEEEVVRVYFKNFAFLYQNQDTVRGFLPYLVPMYAASEEGSSLRVATHAAALCAISQLPGQRQLAFRAAAAYGEAIKTVATALKDPDRAKSDETLQATLLLCLYEAGYAWHSGHDRACVDIE